MTILVQKVWRIGLLTLWQDRGGQVYVSCKNRTYQHDHPVPHEQEERWKRLVETGR